MPETLEIPFLFALGEHVHWVGGGQAWGTAWLVLQQRLTVAMTARIAEYLLAPVADPDLAPVWAYEPDLVSWHARPRI